MSQAKLILSKSPPPWVPLRFFVTAPLFAIAAALVVLWHGEISISSRWSAPILAATHLLVLGFMAMVMTGALIQVVSVLIGGTIPGLKIASGLVHFTLILGTALLASGLLAISPLLMQGAVILLGCAFTLFFLILIQGVINGTARYDSGIGISLALFSLLITIVLGVWLASGYAWDHIPVTRTLTDTHLVWGLIGWVGILVITVGYEVVPMFQLTPPYPARLTRWLGPTLLIALLIWSAHLTGINQPVKLIGGILIAILLAVYSVATLQLQFKRKKKQSDAVVLFWRCAMICLITAVSVWLIGQIEPLFLQDQRLQIFLGILVIAGFAISTINGMLYKIIPFLIWLHLSIKVTDLKLSRRMVPNIKTMIPDTQAKYQFYLHVAAVSLFFLSVFMPGWFLISACTLFVISNLLLLRNLLLALKLFSKTEGEIAVAGAAC